MLVLRDSQGVTDAQAVMPVELVPIVGRFNGLLTLDEIARAAGRDLETEVPIVAVQRLAEELDRGLFLEGPRYREARAKVEHEFAISGVRRASHAGGAYAGEAPALAKYLEEKCLALGRGGKERNGRLVGLIAPHIDPWRGAAGYGHAYSTLRGALSPDADTFILFGTSHAPMAQPFALCNKVFETPLGPLEPDGEALDAIATHAKFDPYADQFNHKREHSLEFQVVFLKHVLGERPARIVPILAGLGAHQTSGTDPAKDDSVVRFLEGVRELVEKRNGRAVIIAGADFAHVGPRFGDARPLAAEERGALEGTDRASLAHAARSDADGFWSHVSNDLDTRRVCGLAPIWSLLRTLPSAAMGAALHYEQTIDKEDGSIVSHAAVAYFG
jgi:AmmeMemoRadiSam system protein B